MFFVRFRKIVIDFFYVCVCVSNGTPRYLSTCDVVVDAIASFFFVDYSILIIIIIIIIIIKLLLSLLLSLLLL